MRLAGMHGTDAWLLATDTRVGKRPSQSQSHLTAPTQARWPPAAVCGKLAAACIAACIAACMCRCASQGERWDGPR